MAVRLLGVFVAILHADLVVSAAPGISMELPAEMDEACDSDGSCGLSLRQLRGEQLTGGADAVVEADSEGLNVSAAASEWCCDKCPHHAFCSPQSGNCYNSNPKHYYLSCGAAAGFASCCDKCSHHKFCSPQSGNCYESDPKHYYRSCRNSWKCCDNCGYGTFCSPNTGRCYDSKAKSYYFACP